MWLKQRERSDGTMEFDSVRLVNGDFLDPGITSWVGRLWASHVTTISITAN